VHTNQFFVGDHQRLSTCSDVAWSRNNTLITCNLTNQAVHVHQYDEASPRLTHLQTIRAANRLGSVDVSPDGNWLAVAHSNPGHRVVLHQIDENGVVSEHPAKVSQALGDRFVHEVHFSRDGQFLLVPQFVQGRSLLVLDVSSLDIVHEYATSFESDSGPQFPKSVRFSHDSSYAFVAYGTTASRESRSTEASIAVHDFSAATGELSEPISAISDGLANIECLAVLDERTLLAVDQYAACVFSVVFDEGARQLTEIQTVLDGKSGLSSPHGISINASGAIALTDHVLEGVRVYLPELGEPPG